MFEASSSEELDEELDEEEDYFFSSTTDFSFDSCLIDIVNERDFVRRQQLKKDATKRNMHIHREEQRRGVAVERNAHVVGCDCRCT